MVLVVPLADQCRWDLTRAEFELATGEVLGRVEPE
jgi:hypothetical protein